MNDISIVGFRFNMKYYSTRGHLNSFDKKYIQPAHPADEAYMVRKELFPNRIITYYVDHTKVFLGTDQWSIDICIGNGYLKGLDKLQLLRLWYTEESVLHSLRKYPTIRKLVADHGKDDSIFAHGGYGSDCPNSATIGLSRTLSQRDFPRYEEELVKSMVRVADGLISESQNFFFNPKELVRLPHSDGSQIPSWLQSALKIGAKVVVKNIISNFDFDFNFDNSSSDCPYNFDGDYDFDDDDNDNDYDNHNVSFRGKDSLPPNANSDGYTPAGNITLTSTVSDIDKVFKHYTKNGHDYVLYNGTYIQVDGSGTVTIGHIKYDKI